MNPIDQPRPGQGGSPYSWPDRSPGASSAEGWANFAVEYNKKDGDDDDDDDDDDDGSHAYAVIKIQFRLT